MMPMLLREQWAHFADAMIFQSLPMTPRSLCHELCRERGGKVH